MLYVTFSHLSGDNAMHRMLTSLISFVEMLGDEVLRVLHITGFLCIICEKWSDTVHY